MRLPPQRYWSGLRPGLSILLKKRVYGRRRLDYFLQGLHNICSSKRHLLTPVVSIRCSTEIVFHSLWVHRPPMLLLFCSSPLAGTSTAHKTNFPISYYVDSSNGLTSVTRPLQSGGSSFSYTLSALVVQTYGYPWCAYWSSYRKTTWEVCPDNIRGVVFDLT